MYTIKIFFYYFLQFLKARLTYKVDFFVSILTNFVSTLSGVLYIFFLINGESVKSIQSWKREEILFIYGYSMLSMSLFMTIAFNLYMFGDRYVIQGQFDRVLLRPINSLFQILFESFNLDSIGTLITGIFLIYYSSSILDIHFSFLDILWLIVSVISASCILISVFVIVASVSFHFQDRIGISAPIFNLINFSRYPINIFNRVIQLILTCIIPFAFVAFYPATHFLNHSEFRLFCYSTPLISILSMFAAASFWKLGVANYSSSGS